MVPANKVLLRALAVCYQGLRGTTYILALSRKWKHALEAKLEQSEATTEQLKAKSLWFSTLAVQ